MFCVFLTPDSVIRVTFCPAYPVRPPLLPFYYTGVGGTSAAEAPGGENEASSAADEAEINNESGAADADARKEEGGREERVASRTRARLPGDAEDRRRQKKARKGKKKKKK